MGSYTHNHTVKKHLREKYKEEFIILTQKASARYQGRDITESCLKIASLESPTYYQYEYTVCPRNNRDLIFYAWYSKNNNGSSGDNYYDAKLEYQVKEYVYTIISKNIVPKKLVTCYVTLTNTRVLLFYKEKLLNMNDILAIEKKLPEKTLIISINFNLHSFPAIKNEHKEAIIKLWSEIIKTDLKTYTRIEILYNYNKKYKIKDSIYISQSQAKSENEVRDYIDKKIKRTKKFWERYNKKLQND